MRFSILNIVFHINSSVPIHNYKWSLQCKWESCDIDDVCNKIACVWNYTALFYIVRFKTPSNGYFSSIYNKLDNRKQFSTKNVKDSFRQNVSPEWIVSGRKLFWLVSNQTNILNTNISYYPFFAFINQLKIYINFPSFFPCTFFSPSYIFVFWHDFFFPVIYSCLQGDCAYQ